MWLSDLGTESTAINFLFLRNNAKYVCDFWNVTVYSFISSFILSDFFPNRKNYCCVNCCVSVCLAAWVTCKKIENDHIVSNSRYFPSQCSGEVPHRRQYGFDVFFSSRLRTRNPSWSRSVFFSFSQKDQRGIGWYRLNGVKYFWNYVWNQNSKCYFFLRENNLSFCAAGEKWSKLFFKLQWGFFDLCNFFRHIESINKFHFLHILLVHPSECSCFSKLKVLHWRRPAMNFHPMHNIPVR